LGLNGVRVVLRLNGGRIRHAHNLRVVRETE
jgi:hypothetical protein